MSRPLDTVLPAFAFYVGFLEDGEAPMPDDLARLFLAGFSEVAGLDTSMEIATVKEGGVNDRLHRLPGRVEVANLTLKRGVGFTDDLWNWVAEWSAGRGLRKSVFVLLANSTRVPLKMWVAERCLPVRYTGPQLSASNSALAIESLELVPERLVLQLSTGDGIEALQGAADI